MKTLPLILLLSCYCWCKDTLVIELSKQSNEGKTVLSLDKPIQITNYMTFCLRMNLKDALSIHYIFNEKDDKLGLKLKFSVGLGSAAINKRVVQFKIPKDNDFKPFHWHHICISSNEKSYSVVFEGQQWYHANHTMKSFEKTTLTKLDIGVSSDESEISSGGVNFKGEMAELNIWGSSLLQNQMIKITGTCGKPYPNPDILSWSDVDPTMLNRNNTNKKDINHLCSPKHSETPLFFYTIMPYLQNQDNAIDTCNVLNAKLAFPKTLDEHHTWNGKNKKKLFWSELTY